MDYPEQPLILKLSESLGYDGCGQVREHSRKILVRHPHPITAGMKMALPLPLLPVKVIELDVDGCRGIPQPIDKFIHGR